ncbi:MULTISPECIES: hypothetical protein [unclassified Thermococcus]|uniref:hypothetical protein n=1 Tax=unclassified Thermococcus TaxID=2627626 RepID=UPI00143ACFE6|nr:MULTISPECIES: hypothetical protein [unclassified Thermococcus]
MSYDLSDPETLRRELRAIKSSIQTTGWKKAYVINWDIEKEVDGIKLIPLWRFLLEEDH